MKHVVCNNQEYNRSGVNVRISERALRDIYLRGFEIAEKEAHPKSLMTALNLVNGKHAANCGKILNDIIRDEWGFSGFVMTDWGTTGGEKGDRRYDPSDSAGCILAGNDLIMPGSRSDAEKLLQEIQADGKTKNAARVCAANLLRVMAELYRSSREV